MKGPKTDPCSSYWGGALPHLVWHFTVPRIRTWLIITVLGKRLFRIWLCMPLREVADIKARLVRRYRFLVPQLRTHLRQDAVQDLVDHPTFEAEFREVAKRLPDLERIVSRIHAKNCRVKDFLKVLEVSLRVVLNSALLTISWDAGIQKAQFWSRKAG